MKVKFGDFTVRQLSEICNSHDACKGCPFVDDAVSMHCKLAIFSTKVYLEFKIDMPEEKEKTDDTETY